jgi:YYY domain-containing protein
MYYTAAVVVVVTALGGFPALGLAGPLLVGGWWLLRTQEDAGFPLLLVVAGAGLVVLVELITVEGERFNTIFKPYAQIWLFWAVGAGALAARLAAGWPADLLDVDRQRLSLSGRALVAVLVVTTGLYGVFALPAHQGEPGPAVDAEGRTLDATAYLEYQYPREAEAIRWLDDREGQPTIVTAAPGGYVWEPDEGQGSSAPASLTGVPTVLGWYHESQYRGEEPYELRLQKVRDIYTHQNRSYQRDLLSYYDVSYVYIGPAERARYGAITVDEVPGVTVAKEFQNVTVYRVEEDG